MVKGARVFALGLALGGLAAVAPPGTGPLVIQPSARARLAAAKQRGDTAAIVVLVAQEQQTEAVARTVRQLGGTLQVRVDPIGYVRARLALDSVARLVALAPLANAAVTPLATHVRPPLSPAQLQSRRDIARQLRALPPAPPVVRTDWREDPLGRPYDPNTDNGVGALRRAHPTYDGRGVTIAQVEYFPDLLAPELGDSPALTLEGRPTRKVIDILTSRVPTYGAEEDAGVKTPQNASPLPFVWVAMTHLVTAPRGELIVHRVRYRAPHAGTYRFGLYDGAMLCRFLDPRRAAMFEELEAPPARGACVFPVLWDTATQTVWVDTDRDRSFADERAMQDYPVRFDVGVFGHDDPTTRPRETRSFTVQTRPADRSVAILTGLGDHATMTASSAVGARGTRGRFDGIAPGARLIMYQTDDIASLAEAYIAAFQDPRVDLVLSENAEGLSDIILGGGPRPQDLLAGRLVRLTGKLFVEAGGNCNSDGCVDERGDRRAMPGVFVVGAQEGRDSWWINGAVRVRERDNNHEVNSWGPAKDGALLPTVLAPSGWLAAFIPKNGVFKNDGVTDIYAYADRGLQGMYHLPPGYGIGGGTSQAAPSFAGALAVLVSAAKQAHLPYDAPRLWLAVTNSACFAPNLPAHQQGNGTVDIDAAFTLLRAYAQRPPALQLATRGPVRTAWSATLPTPHEGVSLFEREGWAPGMHGERTLTLRRTTGPETALTLALSLVGSDGTFTVPASVTLPLNQEVAVPITITTRTAGYHSALLNVDHPSVPGHVHRLLLAVVAAHQFAPEASTLTIVDTLQRPGPGAYYFAVPAGTKTLRVDLQVDDAPVNSQDLRWRLKSPVGEKELWSIGFSKTITAPAPGVWEAGVTLGNHSFPLRRALGRTAVDPPMHVKLTATVQ